MDLENPTNDTEALAAVLQALGFHTTIINDKGFSDTEAALERFGEDLRLSDVGLFFFAGHGIQLNGENYLLTQSVNEKTLDEIFRESLTLTRVRQVFAKNKPRHSVIILDACRNTPAFQSDVAAQGLATTERPYPGFLIAYATDPGNIAFDGIGKNSTFTSAIVRHLATPGLDLRIVFGRIRQEVVLNSSGQQVPWVEESLLEELHLNADGVAADAVVGDEIAAWRRLGSSGRIEDLKTYLDSYPDGLFAAIAKDQLARIERLALGSADTNVPVEILLKSSEKAKIAAALAVLGFMQGRSTEDEVEDEEIVRALEGYARASRTPGGKLNVDLLSAEAARMSIMIGAATARLIEQDMAVLKQIERLRAVADDAIVEINRSYGGTEEGRKALAEARGELELIEKSRNKVLARLDSSRGYYQFLLTRTSRHFRGFLTDDLQRSFERDGSDQQLAEVLGLARFMSRFVRHVDQATDSKIRGSMAWLADFLPEQ